MQCSALVRQVSALSLALCVMKIAGTGFCLYGLCRLEHLVFCATATLRATAAREPFSVLMITPAVIFSLCIRFNSTRRSGRGSGLSTLSQQQVRRALHGERGGSVFGCGARVRGAGGQRGGAEPAGGDPPGVYSGIAESQSVEAQRRG
jgi:hypothetical protein